MTSSKFVRYQLRTTDVPAARAFYEQVFGADFWGDRVSTAPLPEEARARGAPPHWLGHLGLRDVEAALLRIVGEGGARLGPTRPGAADGSVLAVVRDPFGAVLGVSSEAESAAPVPAAYHIHHGRDEKRAFASYASLCGWTATQALDLGPLGVHQMFAWDDSGRTVGSFANTTGQEHVHTQWLFFFSVPDLEIAADKVRALGGLVLPSIRTATGDLVAPCDDAQGAAFALHEAAVGG